MITYPLTLPLAPSEYTLKSVAITGFQASPFTGTQYVNNSAGQWWDMAATFSQGSQNELADLIAVLTALNGQEGTFLFGPYGKEATPRGVASGTPLVNGASQADSKTLITDGWTPDTPKIMKRGDFFSIGTRLYKVLEDADSDSGGNATLSIFPRVRLGTNDGDALNVSSPKGLFRMTSDFTYTFGLGSIYQSIAISALEVV